MFLPPLSPYQINGIPASTTLVSIPTPAFPTPTIPTPTVAPKGTFWNNVNSFLKTGLTVYNTLKPSRPILPVETTLQPTTVTQLNPDSGLTRATDLVREILPFSSMVYREDKNSANTPSSRTTQERSATASEQRLQTASLFSPGIIILMSIVGIAIIALSKRGK